MDEKFYQLVNDPGNEKKAASVAINVSVSRNPTYSENISNSDKREIREYWEFLLLDFYKSHTQGNVSKKEFFCYVDIIQQSMNSKFPDKFICNTEGYDNVFRLAHAQKSLSVFLKHLWCMGKMKEPPFCPIDGIILHDVLKKKGAWTKLNDNDTYCKYIKYVDEAAKKSNLSIAEWEYNNWNKAVEARNKSRKGGKEQTRGTKKNVQTSYSKQTHRNGNDEKLLEFEALYNDIICNLFVAYEESRGYYCEIRYKYRTNESDNILLDDLIEKYEPSKWFHRKDTYKKPYRYIVFGKGEGDYQNARDLAYRIKNDLGNQ